MGDQKTHTLTTYYGTNNKQCLALRNPAIAHTTARSETRDASCGSKHGVGTSNCDSGTGTLPGSQTTTDRQTDFNKRGPGTYPGS